MQLPFHVIQKFSLLIMFIYSMNAMAVSAPKVVDGLIDLTDWHFEKDGPVSLTGDYEFFWQRHLRGTDLIMAAENANQMMLVPGVWNGAAINGLELPNEGYATYRVNVLVGRLQTWALKLPDLGTSYRLLIDNEVVLTVGQPGTSADTTIPKYHPAIVRFLPTSTRVEIVFQISNFDHRLSGLWLPILFGTPEQLDTIREFRIARELFLFGAILVIGFYNLALYSFRRENSANLWLGIFCLVLSIRIMLVGERFFTELMPDLTFAWYLRAEYLCWFIAIAAFTNYLTKLFPQHTIQGTNTGLLSIVGIGILLVLLTSPGVFTITIPFFQLVTIVALVYGTYILAAAVKSQREGARMLFAAFMFLFATVAHDIITSEQSFNNFLLADLGILVFIFTQNILISWRFTRSFKTIDIQREQLQATNIKLHTQEKLRKEAEGTSLALHHRITQSEKMEAIGLLAGGVAHDLNNILSTTVTYPELALAQLPKNSPLLKPLELTRQAGLRAAAVIQDMLTLARRGVVHREVVDLNTIIMDQLESVGHQHLLSNAKNTLIKKDLTTNLGLMEGSKVHLQNLIMNLIANAIDSQADGGTITISTHNEHTINRHLFYSELEAGDYVLLSIEDEGSGILPEDLDKIFEPFYSTKVMGQSGTGLGMSVVWGVVFDHQGAIDVLSDINVGTRFDIYFPRTKQEAPQIVEEEPLDKLQGNKERILVIDDLEEQRQLCSDVLTHLNYKVELCASGEEAVEKLRDDDFDLVLLDMIIEDGWDGLTTYKELIKVKPGIKTILISGFAKTDQVEEALELGAASFINKPYTLQVIAEKIREVLYSQHN